MFLCGIKVFVVSERTSFRDNVVAFSLIKTRTVDLLYTAVPPLLVRTVLGMWGYLGGSQRHGGMCWPLLFAEAAELKRTSTKCAAATAPLKLG